MLIKKICMIGLLAMHAHAAEYSPLSVDERQQAETSGIKIGSFAHYHGQPVAWQEVETVMPESLKSFREGIAFRPARIGAVPLYKFIRIGTDTKTTGVQHLTLVTDLEPESGKNLLASVVTHSKKKLTLKKILESFRSRLAEGGRSLKEMSFFFALLTFKPCDLYPFSWKFEVANQNAVAKICRSLPLCSQDRYDTVSNSFVINLANLTWRSFDEWAVGESRDTESEPLETEVNRFLNNRRPEEVGMNIEYYNIAPHAKVLFK